MTRQKEAMISAWNEIEEALTSSGLLEIKKFQQGYFEAIQERLQIALDTLGEHFSDTEAQKLIKY